MSLVKYLGYAAMIVGVIVNLITLFVVLNNNGYNKESINWIIASYYETTFGIMILFITYVLKNWGNTFNYSLVPLGVQSMLLLFILIYSISINTAYRDTIAENKVSGTYATCSFISSLLLFLQIMGFYILTKNKKESVEKNNNNILIVGLLIIFVLNMWTLVTGTVSLVYFSTDG